MRRLACLTTLAALWASGAAAQPVQTPFDKSPPPAGFDVEIERMAVDKDVVIAGVEVACTGIGDTRADPKWARYPIRVEFSNAVNEYMTDALVALVDSKGEAVLIVRCDSPWLLLKPQPGAYAVYAQLMGSSAGTRSARITVPKQGQKRVVLQFPEL